MGEQRANEYEASPVTAKKARSSFSSKAARCSLIVPSVCWVPLLLVIGRGHDLYNVAAIFELLLLISFGSFLAGFVGLFAEKAWDIVMAILGILLSGSFCFYDFLGIALSGMGHGC